MATGERYAAFTFIDRITALEPGVGARGRFHIPARVDAFAPSLVAEAIGQLAAWVAMAKLGFRLRPVAGIAGEAFYLGAAHPGDTLETEIRIDSCEDDAVAYQGLARIGGVPIVELCDCVGPMLPLDDFDDAAAMRAFFATLCGDGAAPDRFPGTPSLPLVAIERAAGRFASACLDVPREASFFADHFPRRPVFPGTLLLDCMMRLASGVAGEAVAGRSAALRRVTDVKIRAFTEPGARLELRATVGDVERDAIAVALEARAEGQRRPISAATAFFEVRA